MSDDNPHADLSFVCHGELGEENEYGNKMMCGATVTYEEHYITIRRTRRKHAEGDRLIFKCPDCGKTHEVCPVCHGDRSFIGESTGKRLMCHNCQPREAERQRRDPFQ